MVLVCALVGILMSLIFVTYRMSLGATFKGLSQNELLSELQLGVRTVGRALRQSTPDSVTVGTGDSSLSFLTNYDSDGVPVIGAQGQPLWQAYLIYYHDPSNGALLRRRLELAPNSRVQTSPLPIEEYDPGTGRRPIATYLVGGKPVVRLLGGFSVTAHSTLSDSYDLEFRGLQPKKGVRAESRSNLRAVVAIRN